MGVLKMINPINVTSSTLIATESSDNKKFLEKVKSSEGISEVDSKLAQIKESIKNNSYKIDLQKTSEKMALNLLSL